MVVDASPTSSAPGRTPMATLLASDPQLSAAVLILRTVAPSQGDEMDTRSAENDGVLDQPLPTVRARTAQAGLGPRAPARLAQQALRRIRLGSLDPDEVPAP